MWSKAWAGLLGGISCCLLSTASLAQCRMDTDCAGELVCEDAKCVAPAALPPPPAAPAGVAPPTPAPTPAAATPAPAAAGPTRASIAAEPTADLPPDQPAKPATRRHSTAMMVVGIVMVSVGPIPLLMSMGYSVGKSGCQSGGLFANDSSRTCDRNDAAMYTTLVLGVGLIAGGIPMIVIGGKRKPLGRASLTPWATPRAGGLDLRFEL